MSEENSNAKHDNIFFFETQEVTVKDFDASGLILDIGGGGEGIIGQMKGAQVVAIDPKRSELEEAAAGPLKIVMDARELLFLNESFPVVTSFFTLMYINGIEHEKIFEEIYRVLEPSGRFLIWDVELPQRSGQAEDMLAFYFNFKLPDGLIETGYGAKWPERTQGLSYYIAIAERVGFTVSDQNEKGRWFYLALLKA